MVKKHKILFSQVREDPWIEVNAIQHLTNIKASNKDPIKGLLVGSGGCTLFTLLTHDYPLDLDIIDSNPQQLYLIQLKLAIITLLKDCDKVLDFFQGTLSHQEYYKIINSELSLSQFITQEALDFWKEHMDFIYSGINQSGTFEKLFSELVQSDFNFAQVFDRQHLIDRFGESAVVNSMNKEFYDHFMGIYQTYQRTYKKPEDNYFYYQILNNKYHPDNLPYYLSHIDLLLANIHKHRIRFINQDFFSYLNSNNNNHNNTNNHNIIKKYDFIQTSNLTDWLPNQKLKDLIDNIYSSLSEEGIIITRRLNGDYSLAENLLHNKLFSIIDLTLEETSHFYSEVILAFKN